MPKRTATDRATRERALQRAAEVGAAEAGRELGIPAATIRAWRSRAGRVDPHANNSRSDLHPRDEGPRRVTWAQRRERGATSTWEVAEQALRKALQLIKAGDMLAAQRAMIAAGIAADKSGQLEEAAGRSQERQIRVAAYQATLLAEVLRAFLRALDVPVSAAANQIMRQLLVQAGAGGVLVVSPDDAEAARRALREHIASELRAGTDALPSPELSEIRGAGGCSTEKLCVVPEETAVEGDPAVHLRDDQPAGDEVVDGEVVDAQVVYDDEVPQQYVHGYGEKLARQMWERDKRRNAERARREAEQPQSLIVTRPSVHRLDGPRMTPPGGGV